MVKVTHPDRIVFPADGITKGDVVAYYESIGDRMLPHVEARPLTLHRFPKGIGGSGFMQKNAPDHYPESIERIEIPKQDGTTLYPVLREAGDLAYLANQGAIAFHVWTSRLPELDHPDRIVVDLDPPEGDTEQVRTAAHRVRTLLDDVGLPTVPVATGSKGYHLVAPVVPGPDSAALAASSQALAIWLAQQEPDLLTSEFRIAARKGRVFVDWLRNRPGQTAVAPWSLRARDGAPIAMPIEWDDIDDTDPDRYRLTDPDSFPNGDPLLDLAADPTDPAPVAAAVDEVVSAAGIEVTTFDRFQR